jgi:hypothetical protein
MTADNRDAMRTLKGLVYAMGVLIVIAIILLAYGFFTRITDPEFRLLKKDAAQADGDASVGEGGFGEVRVALPEGCTLVDLHAEGPLLFLRLGPPGVCERVLIVGTRSGQLLGSVVLRP